MVGVMIGSGIFVSPRYVLLHSGSVGVTLMVWISSGVMAMFGALCYCELGTMIQRSGGEPTYIREALGPLAGFFSKLDNGSDIEASLCSHRYIEFRIICYSVIFE